MNETKTIEINQLLTKAQLKKVIKILKTAPPADLHRELVAFLSSFTPPLETKGVLPAYLAYWLEWKKEAITHHE